MLVALHADSMQLSTRRISTSRERSLLFSHTLSMISTWYVNIGSIYKSETDSWQCQSYNECLDNLEPDVQRLLLQDHDVLYAAEALQREYYVS